MRPRGALLECLTFIGAALLASPLRAQTPVALDLNGADVSIPGTIQSPSIPTGADIPSPGLSDSTISSVTNNGSQNATLTVGGTGAITTFAGMITDGKTNSTALTYDDASGMLTLSGNNTYTGGTMIVDGTLIAGSSTALGNGSAVTVGTPATTMTATLDLNGNDVFIGALSGASAGIVTNNANVDTALTINGKGATTFSGAITDGAHGTTGLTLTSGSSLTLSGSGLNTYSGLTIVGDGVKASVLAAGGQGAFSANSGVVVSANSTLDIGSQNQTIAALTGAGTVTSLTNPLNAKAGTTAVLTIAGAGGSSTFDGMIQDGQANTPAAGVLTGLAVTNGYSMTLTGNNTYSGGTSINGGTVIGGAKNTFSAASATTINAGGTLDLGGYAQAINTVSLVGGTIQNGILTSSNGITSTGGTVNNIGGTTALTLSSGTTTLQGTNTYSGATTVGAGSTLKGAATNAFSAESAATIVANAFLDLGSTNQAVASLAGGGTVTNLSDPTNVSPGPATAVLTVNNGGLFSGAIVDGSTTGVTTGLAVAGATLTLSGSNTYSGGTMVGGGTLAVTNNASVGTGPVTLNGGAFQNATKSVLGTSSALTFANKIYLGSTGGTFDTTGGDLTLKGTIADAVSGRPGALTVTGGNTLTLTGISSYSGGTTVNAGALSVLGDISSSGLLTMNATSVLSGTGALSSVTFSGAGTLAPGATASGANGLKINGSLTFATASVYLVTINGSNYSSVSVTGTANLSGAALKIAASQVTVGMTYNLLTAGKVNGTFASTPSTLTTTLGNAYSESIKYTPTAVQATFSPLAPSGALNSGGQLSVNDMQTSFATTLLNPNIGNRGGTTGSVAGYGPALGFAPEVPQTPEEKAAYDAVTPHEPLDALMRSLNTGYSHSVWASAYGGYSHITGDSTAGGSTTASTGGGGIASGIDFRIGADTVLGFALGGGAASWSLSGGQGSGTSDTFQAGVYGSHRFGDAYISGTLAYAFNAMHTTRNITTPTVANLTASFNANGVTGRVEGGYRFGAPDAGITPYIAGEFSALRTPSYSESGSSTLALSYNAQTQTNERAEVGLWADKFMPAGNDAIVRLGARIGYAHDWWSSTSFSAQFVALPTQSFTMTGITPPPNLGLGSLLAEVKYRNGVSLSAKFDAEVGQNAYSFAGTGTFRYAW